MSDLNVTMPMSNLAGVDKESPIYQENKKVADSNSLNKDLEATQVEKQEAQVSSENITETIDEMNSFLQSMNRNLSFAVDEQLGESVITVKDSESDEVIRQIPSEELVVLRKKMDDVVGILFDTKV